MIKNSIIMQGSIIEEGVNIKHLIVDKNVRITKGINLQGTDTFPVIISKNTVI